MCGTLGVEPFRRGFRDDGRWTDGVALNAVRLTLNVRFVAFNASAVGLGTTDDRRLQGRECGQFVFIRWLEVACVYFHFLRADDYRCDYLSFLHFPLAVQARAYAGRVLSAGLPLL